MGSINPSLYTGEIEYTPIPGGRGTYWIAPLTQLLVNGNTVPLRAGSGSNAAIDTGTTLVGGPPAQIAALYAQIPGSAKGTGELEGYWTYPCATSVNMQMAFGGKLWPIMSDDFALAAMDKQEQTCLGAFFELDTGGSAPAWIVGDTFLKNVFSVFRFNPPSIGFASLNTQAVMNIADGPVPMPTMGTTTAVVSAGSVAGLSNLVVSAAMSLMLLGSWLL
jgi:cathepsin D